MQVPDLMWVRGMLDLYEAGDSWEQTLSLARLARETGWWRAYGLDDRGYVPLESAATLVRQFNPMVVPGLLQTPDYTRALYRVALTPRGGSQQDHDLKVRAIRQRRLLAEQHPLRLAAVLDESVLHRPVGGRAVLRGQLDHLLITAELDTVTWQVLPTDVGEHPGLDGGFILLSFADLDEPDIVYVEPITASVHMDRAEVVGRCSVAFDRLRSAALSPADSITLVEQLAARG